MSRRTLMLVAVCSLLLAVATMISWVASHGDRGRWRFVFGTGVGKWYAVTSEPGRVAIGRLPAPSSTTREQAMRDAIAGIRNEDYSWVEKWSFSPRDKQWRLLSVAPGAAKDRPTLHIEPFFTRGRTGRIMLSDVARRPLLEALDDPQRFVAAHILLVDFVLEAGQGTTVERHGDAITCCYEGLNVMLLPEGAETKSTGDGSRDVEHYAPTSVRIDSSQLPAVRDRWRQLLEVQLATVPYRAITIATLVIPAVWVGVALSAKRRLRKGLCPACRYDLRATPAGGACPECGRATVPAGTPPV